MSSPSLDEFQKQLRSALNHLYDPDYLRNSPLRTLFQKTGQPVAPLLLQRILIDTIEALHPGLEKPVKSQSWHTYNILLYRYIQQLNQDEVAAQLGISSRQLAREQAVALEVLAYRLWEQFKLSEIGKDTEPTFQAYRPVEEKAGTPVSVRGDDLDWVEGSLQGQPTSVPDAFVTVQELLAPLVSRHAVDLIIKCSCDLPAVTIHPVALRQTLLSLMSVAIHIAEEGRALAQAAVSPQGLEISITSRGEKKSRQVDESDQSSLELAGRLVALSHGSLSLSTADGTFTGIMTLPIFQPFIILVIDDNPDILDLLLRYTIGTRYSLLGTQNPNEIINLVEKHSPRAIVLDVMMPEIDGWQVLGRLRRHPLTSAIPIVVCTIIAQEELAFALGASGYVRKPVMREAFLSALDRLFSEPSSASR